MRRDLLLLFALLLPAVGLAFIAFGVAERNHTEGIRALERDVDSELAAFARRVEGALEDAVKRAREQIVTAELTGNTGSGPTVGYLDSSGRVVYEIPSAPASPSLEDLRLFSLAIRGGEEYEFARRDPARAVDAYAFYLPRIESPELRARLRYRVARAAREAGQGVLATEILRGLFENDLAVREGRIPLDLLAGRELLQEDREGFSSALRERVIRRQRQLETAALDLFWRPFAAGGDDPIARQVAERRGLESLLARNRPTGSEDVHLDLAERALLYLGPRRENGWRPVVRVAVDLPELQLEGYEVRLETVEIPARGSDQASRGVELEGARRAAAFVGLRDLRFPEKVRELDRIRTLQRVQVALLLLLLGGTGFGFLAVVSRKRRLAELRTRLLANVSHELKTPVTSIRIFAELLAEDRLDRSRARHFGKLIQAESLRLGQLIEDLLDYTSRDRVRQPLASEPVPLRELLAKIAAGFGYRARECQVQFRNELPDTSAAWMEVHTDAPSVERIVLNLLDNALKYRSQKDPWIALTLRRGDRGVQIAVRDNGLGVSRGEQEKIFEEFYRARFEDFAVQGAGLGLAIARRLASELGGRLFLESRPGQGSTFTLELPSRRRQPEKTDEKPDEEERKTG